MESENYDFSGWATRNDILCTDGRTIRQNAFAQDDGKKVPLVWMHQHDDPENVLGHAYLENRPEGVWAYGKFNDTDEGQRAKELVKHGDIEYLSIFANHLRQDDNRNVEHGSIKEVSLVLAGANSGATIENVMLEHSDGWTESPTEAEMYFNQKIDNRDVTLEHSDCSTKKEKKKMEHSDEENSAENEESEDENATVGEIFDSMTDQQKAAVYAVIGDIVDDEDDDDDDNEDDEDEDSEEADLEEGDNMKYNVFEGDDMENDEAVLTHADEEEIIGDAKRYGSLKDSVLAHADEYGIKNIDVLFPDAKNLTSSPDFIKRETAWVSTVMNGAKHTPFSRIKSTFADITADEARAKGYTKGKKKVEEVFSLLKRTTAPTTVYKKQKIDRDDVIDITDFDVISWLKSEMRIMLDEEIARAALIGDGRPSSSDDHISTDSIRPIATDDDLYAVKVKVELATADAKIDYKELIKSIIRARKDYKGTGTPTLFTTEEVLTEMLLLEDTMGHPLYEDTSKLATKLRVSSIVTVEVMENTDYLGILVNMADYTFGADKGGAVSMFDDFDIDYNQQKYLIETRCSGALTKPYSAIVVTKSVKAGA